VSNIGCICVTVEVRDPFTIMTSVSIKITRRGKGGRNDVLFCGIGMTSSDIACLKLLKLLCGTELVGHDLEFVWLYGDVVMCGGCSGRRCKWERDMLTH